MIKYLQLNRLAGSAWSEHGNESKCGTHSFPDGKFQLARPTIRIRAGSRHSVENALQYCDQVCHCLLQLLQEKHSKNIKKQQKNHWSEHEWNLGRWRFPLERIFTETAKLGILDRRISSMLSRSKKLATGTEESKLDSSSEQPKPSSVVPWNTGWWITGFSFHGLEGHLSTRVWNKNPFYDSINQCFDHSSAEVCLHTMIPWSTARKTITKT